MKKTFTLFRKVAIAEGISFLLLLLVAMPLKYLAGEPLAVTVIGGLHGILFVAFIVLAILVKEQKNKSLGWLIKAFIASIIPFGTIIMDRKWKVEGN